MAGCDTVYAQRNFRRKTPKSANAFIRQVALNRHHLTQGGQRKEHNRPNPIHRIHVDPLQYQRPS